jgi:octaprenyl-diphosphate synthase
MEISQRYIPKHLEAAYRPALKDLVLTNTLISAELTSNVQLVHEITQHIIENRGKQLRPLTVILSACACGYPGETATEHRELAAIIEFVHTATLLHDDVIDESKLRRGQQTANAVWDNQATVLAGDFLYSRAFQMLARRSNITIMQCLANTTNAIAEGEIQQLMNQNNPEISKEAYQQVIYRKTAKLFESAAEIGAILAQQDQTIQQALADYGRHLGMAFQIIDDLLDYCADSAISGKNIGDDLAEGKMTLPLIIALQKGNAAQKNQIRQAIIHGRKADLPDILNILKETGALQETQQEAKVYVDQATADIQILPDSTHRDALLNLAAFAIDREF